jgi:hypothetical protein
VEEQAASSRRHFDYRVGDDCGNGDTKEVLSFRKLVRDFGHPPQGATTIFEDNQACIAIAQNPTAHGRTKHFDVAQLFVRERVTIGDIRLEYINTKENTADLMTKPLGKALFDVHRSGLGMFSLSAQSRGSVGVKALSH